MGCGERRKCKCCRKLFRPDPRNRRHQYYCSAPACRAASKAASQARWLAKPENQNYFRDRLARSTRDLLNTLDAIAGKGAGFRSLGDAWADTTTPHGRLMLTVLGGLAEFERELIRARTHEGRERARANGVKLGRTPKLTPHQRREAIKRRDAGEATREIARSYNVSHSTISRLSP
jgi:Resolvase, N terminal domain/Helix-turn-helix domain